MILVVGGEEDRNVSEESSEVAANVTGLLPGTEYMFRVVAVSEFRGVQAPSSPSDSVPGTTETSGEAHWITLHHLFQFQTLPPPPWS